MLLTFYFLFRYWIPGDIYLVNIRFMVCALFYRHTTIS